MLNHIIFILTFAAAIGSAIVAGIFYAFSSFVMAALARLTPEQGAAAMNHINVTVLTRSFFIPFFGTAILSLVLLIWGFIISGASGAFLIVASLAYLVGCIAVTMRLNVPLNDRLRDAPPEHIVEIWKQYRYAWTFWNSLRTAASLLSALFFIAALLTRAA